MKDLEKRNFPYDMTDLELFVFKHLEVMSYMDRNEDLHLNVIAVIKVVKAYCEALEKELKYSKAMLIDQIKKKRDISKRYGELLKEVKSN